MYTNTIYTTESNKFPFAAIIIASLGYFVDIYDLLLFSIIRVPSLKSFGLNGRQFFSIPPTLIRTIRHPMKVELCKPLIP